MVLRMLGLCLALACMACDNGDACGGNKLCPNNQFCDLTTHTCVDRVRDMSILPDLRPKPADLKAGPDLAGTD